MRSLWLLFLCLVSLAAIPALANAQGGSAPDPQVNAPPGTSGIDEYLETVPGADGNRPASPGGGSNGPGGPGRPGGASSAVPPAVRAELERTAEGRKALALAETGASAQGSGGRNQSADSRTPEAQGEVRGDGFLSGVARSLTGSDRGGMGFGLPLLLVGSALTIGLMAALRRRRA